MPMIDVKFSADDPKEGLSFEELLALVTAAPEQGQVAQVRAEVTVSGKIKTITLKYTA